VPRCQCPPRGGVLAHLGVRRLRRGRPRPFSEAGWTWRFLIQFPPILG
jgi:hypothetical protein